jgi:cellulose synthase/poly-beta-1,6-N-acetylglucosamine synthase-like glycosyltransferase
MALPFADNEILILADASGIFAADTVRRLIGHFQDPRVGLVVGRKRIRATGTAVAEGDGIYWRYDALLRDLESRTGSTCVGAEGGLTAIRRHLFPVNFPPDIAEDFAMGCELFKQGYLCRYEPAAVVYETPSATIDAEFNRKVRVIVKGIRTFFHFRALLNPLRSFSYPFQTVSHKLLRWLGPALLVALFVSSGVSHDGVQRWMFYLQMGFYGMALLGSLSKSLPVRLTAVPLYFTTVNLAALVAWGLVFKKYSVWEPARREQRAA